MKWNLSSTPHPAWAAAPGDAPPSNTTGLLPALGYLGASNGGNPILSPGQSTTLTLGVQSMTPGTDDVIWSASVPQAGVLQLSSTTRILAVNTETKATQGVQVSVPSSTPDGRYLITISLRSGTGVQLPNVVAEVDVVRPR